VDSSFVDSSSEDYTYLTFAGSLDNPLESPLDSFPSLDLHIVD